MTAPTTSGDLIALLRDPCFTLPLLGEPDLETQIRLLFDKYDSALGALPSGVPANDFVLSKRPQIRVLISAIRSAVKHQMQGMWSIAFRRFREGLHAVRDVLADSLTNYPRGLHRSDTHSPTACPPLYRLREEEVTKTLSRGEMFHLPFHMRDNVSLQRFSLPGLPCLYLGRSTYTCWQELGRKPLTSLWVVQLQVMEAINVLPIVLPHRDAQEPGSVATATSHRVPTTQAMAVLWPLYAACLLRRRDGTRSGFVPEYIIPQMLLEAIVTHQRAGDQVLNDVPLFDTTILIDAVTYPSTRAAMTVTAPLDENFVFPVRTHGLSGHCASLASLFTVSQPIAWQYAAALPRRETRSRVERNHSQFRVPIAVLYKDSEFGHVEAITDDLVFLPP